MLQCYRISCYSDGTGVHQHSTWDSGRNRVSGVKWAMSKMMSSLLEFLTSFYTLSTVGLLNTDCLTPSSTGCKNNHLINVVCIAM